MASTESDVEHIYVSQCCGTIIIKKHRGYQKQENVGRYVSEHHGLYETDLISQGRGQDSRYAGKYIRTEQLGWVGILSVVCCKHEFFRLPLHLAQLPEDPRSSKTKTQ